MEELRRVQATAECTRLGERCASNLLGFVLERGKRDTLMSRLFGNLTNDLTIIHLRFPHIDKAFAEELERIDARELPVDEKKCHICHAEYGSSDECGDAVRLSCGQ